MTMRALLFVPFVVAVLSAGSPDKGSFTSGVWHGKANYDGDGKFSDCTMMAQPVSLLIDARKPMRAIAKVIDAHGILIPLENTNPVLDALRHGKVLTIVADGAKFSFKLTGTRDAIAALAACVARHRGSERVEQSTRAPA